MAAQWRLTTDSFECETDHSRESAFGLRELIIELLTQILDLSAQTLGALT